MSRDRSDHWSKDPVAGARADTLAFTKRKIKRYGLLTLGNTVAVAFILKGMPGHSLWPVLGIPLILCFACFFTPTLYYTAMLMGEWLDKKQHP